MYSSRFLAYGTLSSPDERCDENVVVGGFHTIDFSDLYYHPIVTSITSKAGCPPYVNPRLSMPAELTDVDPAWRTCQPLFYGEFDPPRVLTKVTGSLLSPPTTTKSTLRPLIALDPSVTEGQGLGSTSPTAVRGPQVPAIPSSTTGALFSTHATQTAASSVEGYISFDIHPSFRSLVRSSDRLTVQPSSDIPGTSSLHKGLASGLPEPGLPTVQIAQPPNPLTSRRSLVSGLDPAAHAIVDALGLSSTSVALMHGRPQAIPIMALPSSTTSPPPHTNVVLTLPPEKLPSVNSPLKGWPHSSGAGRGNVVPEHSRESPDSISTDGRTAPSVTRDAHQSSEGYRPLSSSSTSNLGFLKLSPPLTVSVYTAEIGQYGRTVLASQTIQPGRQGTDGETLITVDNIIPAPSETIRPFNTEATTLLGSIVTSINGILSEASDGLLVDKLSELLAHSSQIPFPTVTSSLSWASTPNQTFGVGNLQVTRTDTESLQSRIPSVTTTTHGERVTVELVDWENGSTSTRILIITTEVPTSSGDGHSENGNNTSGRSLPTLVYNNNSSRSTDASNSTIVQSSSMQTLIPVSNVNSGSRSLKNTNFPNSIANSACILGLITYLVIP